MDHYQVVIILRLPIIGGVFVTSLTFGGFLSSTRNVTDDEKKSLDQIKDQTRIAAGLSVQTPSVGASAGVARTSGTSSSTGQATIKQEARLAWDAHGGNTLLASKSVPPFSDHLNSPPGFHASGDLS